MKKISGIFIAIILFLGLSISNFQSQTISPFIFGQNAWMPDTIGKASSCMDPPCLLNGKLHKKWADVASSGAKVVRFGGISPDKNRPTDYQYIKMIDSIRSRGMEPVMQVPFMNWRYTAQQAAAIVQFVNITKSRNVKYWIIGNEPDLGYSFTSSSQIAAYIKTFSSAMKAVDPTIKIIGPECAWYNQGIINGLTTPNGPDDITGKDNFGRYYIDAISFHIYPFNGSQTRSQVIFKLTSPGSFQDNLIALNQRLNNCNSFHGRTGTDVLRTAVTEANVSWQNSSSDGLYANGANSFIGGQFIAEMMGIAMKQNVQFLNIWSVIEGNSLINNIGYLDPSSGKRKPSFYHFQLLADHFSGNYLNGVSGNTMVKTFGCKKQNEICVLIMNEDQSNGLNFALSLNSSPISGNYPLKLNIDANLSSAYFTDYISAQSTILLRFDIYGNLLEKIVYSLDEQAVNNAPPLSYLYNITTGSEEISNPSASGSEPFSIKNVFPIPSVDGKVSILIGKGNASPENDFLVEVFNLSGQLIYSKKLFFRGGKEEIDIGQDAGSGMYILRIKSSQEDKFLNRKIMIIRN
jgi:hypothetical protein